MSKTISTRAIIALVSASSTLAWADGGVPLPRSMGALGDSITKGAFADYRRQDGIYPWTSASFLLELVDYAASSAVDTAINPNSTAENDVIDNPELSWSTGQDPLFRMTSHASRLAYLSGLNGFQAANFGITGSLAHSLVTDQVPQMIKWSEFNLGQSAPDYVTVLIGNNDICSDAIPTMTPVQSVVSDMNDSLTLLLEKSPKTHILVSSLPQIYALKEILASQTDTGGYVGKTRTDMWAITNECPRVLQNSDPAQQAAIKQMVLDYDQQIGDMVAGLIQKYGDRVRYSTQLANTKFTPDDMAMDCFHPGYSGQNRLAEFTFNDTWWKDQWNGVASGYQTQIAPLAAKAQQQQSQACQAEYNSKGGVQRGGACTK